MAITSHRWGINYHKLASDSLNVKPLAFVGLWDENRKRPYAEANPIVACIFQKTNGDAVDIFEQRDYGLRNLWRTDVFDLF